MKLSLKTQIMKIAKNNNFIKLMKKKNPKNNFKAKVFFLFHDFLRFLPFFITRKPKARVDRHSFFLMNFLTSIIERERGRDKGDEKGEGVEPSDQ